MRWGLVLLVVVASCALLSQWQDDSNDQVALLGVDSAKQKAQADQSLFSIVFARAKQDKQAVAMQRRLAAKDIRLSQSLSQAASAQASEGARAEQRLMADVRRHTVLVSSVHKLSSVLGAEEMDLNMATAHLTKDSKNELALRHALPQLHRAEADLKGKLVRVLREEKRARRGVATQRAEEMKAKQVLRQSLRAYNNYGVRKESAYEKEKFVMSKAGLLRAKALVAARKARLQLSTAHADAAKAPAKARGLRTDAANDEAAASLLKARAAESIKNAQVWAAKEQEAGSYMKMMKADVNAAEKRVHEKESMQHQSAMKRVAQRHLERELREAEREERKGDIAQARLLHDAVQNKGVVGIGIQDVRRTRKGLREVLGGMQQAEHAGVTAEHSELEDRKRVQVDEAQAQSLHFAAAEHQVAARHLGGAEKAAASEARGLMNRAKDMLTFASEDTQAVAAQEQLATLDQQARALARTM